MILITKFVYFVSERSRNKRIAIFKDSFIIDEKTKILDLGSENGTNINNVLKETKAKSSNIYIADIIEKNVFDGQRRFGFNPVVIREKGSLPFPDNFFDIVYCSSVIEHATVAKEQIWSLSSDHAFKKESYEQQKRFANEIRRVGKQYYVQTPNKYFLVESHTWLPFVGFLPRKLLLFVIGRTNLFWIKKSFPDWNLLDRKMMLGLFCDAKIMDEKIFGITKSIIAIYSNSFNK